MVEAHSEQEDVASVEACRVSVPQERAAITWRMGEPDMFISANVLGGHMVNMARLETRPRSLILCKLVGAHPG